MKMNAMPFCVALAAAASCLDASASALSLGFDSLPTAQGWSFHSQGTSEASVADVDGTTLSFNSLGTGDEIGYRNSIPVDTAKPFALDLTIAIPQAQHTPCCSTDTTFRYFLYTGSEAFEIGLSPGQLSLPNGGRPYITFDTGAMHSYRLIAYPGERADLYVDGFIVATAFSSSDSRAPAFGFGDTRLTTENRAYIQHLSISQVPEPAAGALVAVGVALLAGLHCRLRRSAA